jgi:biotin carboxyl carrier protein
MKYLATINDETYEVEINQEGIVTINGEQREVDFRSMGQPGIFSLIIYNQSFEAVIERREDQYHILIFGDLYEVKVTDERTMRLLQAGGGVSEPVGEIAIKSPMPGLIVDVPVTEGQAVKKGQTVVILESMKMENELKAPRDGIIHRIDVSNGDSVEQNRTLVTIT